MPGTNIRRGGGESLVTELADPAGDEISVGQYVVVTVTADATVTLPEEDGVVTILSGGTTGKKVTPTVAGTDTIEPGLSVTAGQSKELTGTTASGVRNWAPTPGPGSWEYVKHSFADLDSQELNATDADQTLSNGMTIIIQRRGNHGSDDVDIVNGQGLVITSPVSALQQYIVFPLSQLFTDTSYRLHARWRVTFVFDLANTTFSGAGRKQVFGIGGREDWDDASDSLAMRGYVVDSDFRGVVWHDTDISHVVGDHDGVAHEYALAEYDPIMGSARFAYADSASVPATIGDVDTLQALTVVHSEARSWNGTQDPPDPIQAATEQQDAFLYLQCGGSSDKLTIKEVHVWRERPAYDPLLEG